MPVTNDQKIDTGAYVIGELLGISDTDEVNRESGEVVKTKHHICLATYVPHAKFPDRLVEESINISLPPAWKQTAEAYVARFSGKCVIIKCVPQAWASNGKEGVWYGYQGGYFAEHTGLTGKTLSDSKGVDVSVKRETPERMK